MRWCRFLVMALLVAVVAGFVRWTFPTQQNSKRSQLTIEVLPAYRWGMGYYCADSPSRPESGYYYGILLLKRTYYFRP